MKRLRRIWPRWYDFPVPGLAPANGAIMGLLFHFLVWGTVWLLVR